MAQPYFERSLRNVAILLFVLPVRVPVLAVLAALCWWLETASSACEWLYEAAKSAMPGLQRHPDSVDSERKRAQELLNKRFMSGSASKTATQEPRHD